jgi:hypothetical protein
MFHHQIIISDPDREKVRKAFTEILQEKGCQVAFRENEEPGLKVFLHSDSRHVSCHLSDPFFIETQLFSSPNDFFLPLSEMVKPNAVVAIDYDDENDVFQYWIFSNGSCVDQYHSLWRDFSGNEQEGIKGNADSLHSVFPSVSKDQWQQWLDAEHEGPQAFAAFKDLAGLKQVASPDDIDQEDRELVYFRLPELHVSQQLIPKHLFPWILLATPAAYYSLRYYENPELKPAPHTPSDSQDLHNTHHFLQQEDFTFFGDYMVNIAAQVQTFIRLYFRPKDNLHISISRIESPVDVSWQTEVSSHFTDDTKVSTTNAFSHSPFSLPQRIIFWKPEMQAIKDLLSFHLEKLKDFTQGRKPEVYTEENYLTKIKESIQKDYLALQKAGYLQMKTAGMYGLTWRGAIRMLYKQWKSSRQQGDMESPT